MSLSSVVVTILIVLAVFLLPVFVSGHVEARARRREKIEEIRIMREHAQWWEEQQKQRLEHLVGNEEMERLWGEGSDMRKKERPMRSQTDAAIAKEAEQRKQQAKSDMKKAREAKDFDAAREASDRGRRMGNIAKRFGSEQK